MRHVFLHCDSPLPMAPGTSPYRIKGEFYRHLSELLAHLDERIHHSRGRLTVDHRDVGDPGIVAQRLFEYGWIDG